jgi:hypothetical protein
MLASLLLLHSCGCKGAKLHFTKNEATGKTIYSITDSGEPFPKDAVLVACLSSCSNTVRREAIRHTWAKFPGNWVLRFVLGECPRFNMHSDHMHSDLLVTNVTDDYYSIPAKSAAIIAYARAIRAKWAFKTDDDSFINIPVLLDFLGHTKTEHYAGRFGPQLANGEPGIPEKRNPMRNPKSKWYVSEKQYPSKLGGYPPFASGIGYALRDTALDCMMHQIETAALYIKTMFLEDVYMGLLAKECKLKRIGIPNMYIDPNQWNRTKKADFVLVHYMKPDAFLHMYKIATVG